MTRRVTLLYLLISLSVLFTVSFPLGQTGSLPPTSEPRAFTRVDLSPGQKYAPGEVLVRFKPGTDRRSMLSSHARVGGVVKREFQSVPGLQHVKLSTHISVKQALHSYRTDPNVLYAEPNYILHPFTLPNDPLFGQQWGLSNTGQDRGTPGADIHAEQAWGITTGSSNVVVAVIDTGIDYTHPDLAANVWLSPTSFTQTFTQSTVTCPAGTFGYTPGALEPCDPMDLDGHGTHVAGIIGAVGNNALGISGVNWNVQMMPCNFTSDLDTIYGAVDCLNFVKAMKDQGVNVIATNNSYGGTEFYSQALADAIAAQQQDGILFIAAAGNSFQDNDLIPTTPASFFLPNVISVAATDRYDNLPTFSNFGRYSVHLGAPGVDILSTLPGGVYGLNTGTSMSAPFVTGVAALLKAANPSWDWRTIRNQILAGGDTIPALANTVTGKRLNAYGALTCSNSMVASRLQPTTPNIAGAVGSPVTLAYLNINCGQPNGPVSVQSSSGSTINLVDDGTGADQAAGDGIYTGQFTPSALGSYTLTFPGGDEVNLQVLANYYPYQVPLSQYSYRSISGTNLNLGDDSVAAINSPFPIQFGGGSFSTLYVSSNGTISFTDVFGAFDDVYLPPNASAYPAYSTITTLVAPFWQDLYPVQVSGNSSATDNNVFWEVIGSAPNRELVVEWRDVESYACRGDTAATVKFQVVFDESTSNVLFNYANTEFGGSCLDEDHGARAEVGIQVAPSAATTWGFEQAVLGNNSGILWKPITGTQSSNPVPVITTVSPTTVQAGGGDLVVTITGSNFLPQSLAECGSPVHPTTYVSSTELQVLILAADILNNGTVALAVINPSPGGGTSNWMNITVSGMPPPVITAINPSSAVAGGFGFRMEVDGTGFGNGFGSPSSTVQWNGTPLQTIAISAGTVKLVADVTSNLIASAGTVQITVNNQNLGGVSNPVPFTITTASSSPSTTAGAATSVPPTASRPPGFTIPGTVQSRKFLPRFMGWKRAGKEGPEFVQHFLRTHAGTPLRPTNGKRQSAGTFLHPQSLAQTLSSQALPGFQFRPSLPADLLPTSVATGDFNRDGHMDWVVANGGANSLWIYFGKGDGTSQIPLIIPLKGQSPDFVVAADLRGIGILDLVVAEADSGTIGVMLGNGDGTFGVETTYYVPAPPLCLLVDDFNGDGHKDIVAGMDGSNIVGEIAFLPGDGTGHFGAPIYRGDEHPDGVGTDYAAYSLAEADLNGDGFPDLVVLDINDAGDIYDASALLNQKDGTFKATQVVDWAMPTLDNILTNVTAGDVNGDGCADVVDTNGLGAATVFLGNCDGTFQNQGARLQLGLGDIAGGLTLADVNGDGKLDIVTSSVVEFNTTQYGVQPGNLVSVLLGGGAGNFGAARVFRGQPSMYSLALADLNGDGKLDIVTANQDADSVSVFLNDGSGGFGPPEGGYIGYPPPSSGTVADAAYGSGSVQGGIYGEPRYGLKVADVNGDGKPDLVGLDSGRNYPDPLNLSVELNTGAGVFSKPVLSAVMDGSYSNPNFVGDWAMGNFRNTGLPDFVAIGSPWASGSSMIAFAKNNGDGTFSPLPLAQPAGAQGLIGVGDFNGDGNLDIVVLGSTINGSLTNYTFNVFLGNGDGTFRAGYSATAASGGDLTPYQVWVGDFNGDGKADVLALMQTNGFSFANVLEFLGNGDGTFAPGKIVLQNFGPMNVADLNHDGIGDIVEMLGANAAASQQVPLQYAVYLGQRDGSFVLQNTYTLSAGLLSYDYLFSPGVVLGDFNGDGNIDIAAFQDIAGDSVLQILAGNGDGTFTPTYSTFDFNQFVVPQYAADLNGDGKSDLLEMDGYGSAFQIVPATTGPALQADILTYPIFGSTGTASVTLAAPSASATTIQLAASDPAISIPASITIPANAPSQNFQFQIGSGFNPQHVFSIQATLGTQSATAYGWKSNNTQGTFVAYLTTLGSWAVVAGQTTGDYDFALSSIFDYSTNVQFSCTGLPSWASCQFPSGPIYLPPGGSQTSAWVVSTTSAAVVGSYPFTMVASDGTVTEQLSATLNIGDFGLSITPSTATALTTGLANYSLSISSIDGYGGLVQTSVSGLPAGATVTCCLTDVGGGSNVALTIQTTNVAVGSYPFTITGTAGSLTRSANATLVVQEPPAVTESILPASATALTGQSANFTITLNSQNGATGAVTLQCSNLPGGATCAFNPSAPTLPANGSVSDALTVQVSSSVAAGSYPFTVMASSGSLTASAAATLVVQPAPSFSGSMSPTSATLSVGQSANFSITLNSQNGATGAVTLQCLNVSSGSACTFTPTSPTLPANGSVSDQLTVQVNTRPAAAPPVAPFSWTPPGVSLRMFWLLATLAGCLVLGMELRRRKLNATASAAALLGVVLLFLATASCGGGGGGSTGTSPPPSPVVETITVQASGAGVSGTQTLGTLTITVN